MEREKETLELLRQIKQLSKRYREVTGRPLGCTGEIAEYEAVKILGLELAPVRQAGYDAVRRRGDSLQRIQIKGRCVLPKSKPGQRVGRIDLLKDWDSVILVLLDENLDATVMYEAEREAIVRALEAPGSKARNERGALGVPKFKSIGRTIWSK